MNTRSTHSGPFTNDRTREWRQRLIEQGVRVEPELSRFDLYWPSIFGLCMGTFAVWVIWFYGWVR